MAIVQISKIQVRSGNLVDLPQLDNGELGWAADEDRLFIGRTGNNISSENIEVLTSYSNISFSQINGSDGGNFNITNPNNGQILTYVSSTDTWENYTGNISQFGGTTKLQLGDVANINMGGGATGYVLETDGLGNLSWTPKGVLFTPIKALSNANPIVMTVANTTPYTSGQEITISGVLGTNANTVVNGQNFYITLSNNFPTSGNVSLYTNVNRTIGANGATLTATALTGTATAVIAGGGGGSTGAAGGTQNQVQFNDGGILSGNTGFTFTKGTGALEVPGNLSGSNLNATGTITAPILISNIAAGTSPLTISSTTRVANLNVAYSNVTDFTNITTATTGNYYPILTNALTGNVAEFANSVLVYNVGTGTLTTTLYTGTLTTASQPNITSVGTLTSLAVTGNTTSGNFVGIFANGTSNINIPTSSSNIIFGVAGNAGIVLVTGTGINVAGTINATGNITGNVFGPLANGNSNVRIATANGNVTVSAVGNTVLTVTGTGVNVAGTFNTGSGNANVGNIGVTNRVIANIIESTVATGTSPFTVASATQVPNLYATRANVSDLSTFTALTTGTYYLPLVSGTAAANYAFGSNTAFSVNVANGSLTATTFIGNVVGNISGNIQVNGSNTQILFNDNGNANASAGFTFNKLTNAVSITGNLTSANASLGNLASANYFSGTLTTAAQPNITSVGTLSALSVTATITGSVSGSAGTAGSATTAGTVTTAAQPNITSVGTLTGLGVNGTLTAVNITANSGLITGTLATAAQPNITSVGTLTSLTTTTITSGSNSTAGTITGNWSLSTGSRLNATYADLAEYYEADIIYEPGTVLEFGGEKEVTLAQDGTSRVAGVVSTDPAYAMNTKCPGIATAIALQGRVPTKVRGIIRKGDMMVSGGNGFARPSSSPTMGTVIGKALENFDGIEGVIEVAVGRL